MGERKIIGEVASGWSEAEAALLVAGRTIRLPLADAPWPKNEAPAAGAEVELRLDDSGEVVAWVLAALVRTA